MKKSSVHRIGPSQKYLLATISMDQENTATIVDVMGCLRRLRLAPTKTFHDLSSHFLELHGISSNSNRIDFVFDTYIEGLIKDSE